MGRALSVVVLRIELADVVPMVWRRVRVPAVYTLRRAHGVIQIAMGWQDCHLHEYRVGDTRVGMADRADMDVSEGLEEEEEWTVADALKSGATEFEYVYDFGDQWRHRIVIEPATRSRVPGASLLCAFNSHQGGDGDKFRGIESFGMERRACLLI
jgi:Plasmid pRiA4b ORF-3-like protein